MNFWQSSLIFWRDLSVSKKLYVVIGVMGLLIASELFTLFFAMSTLSSVRAFVQGEGFWSKAEKEAVIRLEDYVRTHDQRTFDAFETALAVPLGDRIARNELMKKNPNLSLIWRGFIQGGNHPDDIPGLIKFVRRFHSMPYLAEALRIWNEGDEKMQVLVTTASLLRSAVILGNETEVQRQFAKILELNTQLSVIEDDFSKSLAAGSRWLESVLMSILVIAVLLVEATSVFLTVTFSRRLSFGLQELCQVATKVGKGEFDHVVEIKSGDEIGQLAKALNTMVENLRNIAGERRTAESANQIKSLFLANMSHEIRTPLSAILGFAELLRESSLTSDEHHEYVEIIHRTGMNLTRIINDILDLSKVEAGRLEIEGIDFSLHTLLKDIQSLLELRCSEKGIAFEFVYEPGLPDDIHTDPVRLRQVLMNILSNAIKFTSAGYVRLNCSSRHSQLFFEVSDSGVGLTAEQSDVLFQPFSQADNSTSRRFEGTGLGLVLSRRLAQLLGGDVLLLESAPQTGSRFLATINLSVATSKIRDKIANSDRFEGTFLPASPRGFQNVTHTPISHSDNTLGGKNILIVEDVAENRVLLERILVKRGAKVTMAKDGSEGVSRALAGKFDLVVMDVQIPVLDGYAATQKLRSQGFDKPIIALTAHAMKEDRMRCMEAGYTDYLTKPIQAQKFIATLNDNLL